MVRAQLHFDTHFLGNHIYPYLLEDIRSSLLQAIPSAFNYSIRVLQLTANSLIYPDSPRIYVSTNPWKITATFQTISSTREEYLTVIEELKKEAPGPLKKGEKRSRLDQAHLTLIESLENRIGAIDAEIAVSCFLHVSLLLCIARGIWSGGILAVLCLHANCVFVASCSSQMSSVCNESNGR